MVVITLLVALVAVLVLSNLRVHRKLNDKNEVIIRGIQENIQLREQLQHLLTENENKQ